MSEGWTAHGGANAADAKASEVWEALPQPEPHRQSQAVMQQFPADLPKDEAQDGMFPGDWSKDMTRGFDLVQVLDTAEETLDDIVQVAKSNGTRSMLCLC